MTLRASLSSTQRAFARPASNAQQLWTERQSCILTLQGDDRLRGRGEAAPLPGFSADRLEDCAAALGALELANIPERLENGRDPLLELTNASARLPVALPAARAALEGALLDLWSRAARRPAWALLASSETAPGPRALAALLMGEPEQAVEQALRAQDLGFRSFKLKIGRAGARERELSAVAQLRRRLAPNATLRLDANRSLSVDEARAELPRFAIHDLEYIEEPCAPDDVAQLADLALPIAWDESLAERPLPTHPLRALVLKPTLLGGISACAAWATRATDIGAGVIISHAFEGPLGLALNATIALRWGTENVAQGLALDGARLAPSALSCISGPRLVPWSEPGLGVPESS